MEFAQMRDFMHFCDQLNEMRLRFYKWDSCERTVALYYLMAGLPFANARFLQNCLDQCIQSAITPEAQLLERNANDPIYISRLLLQKPQVCVWYILCIELWLIFWIFESCLKYFKIVDKIIWFTFFELTIVDMISFKANHQICFCYWH